MQHGRQAPKAPLPADGNRWGPLEADFDLWQLYYRAKREVLPARFGCSYGRRRKRGEGKREGRTTLSRADTETTGHE